MTDDSDVAEWTTFFEESGKWPEGVPRAKAPVSPIARDFEFGYHECSFDLHESSTGEPVPPRELFRELEEERKASRMRVPPAIYAQAAADAEAIGIDSAYAVVFFPELEDMSQRITARGGASTGFCASRAV